MLKTVIIVQSCYIPWRGYFDLIAQADEFILFDDMQFTKRDWRNRNQIKTPQGLQWLTIPVITKGRYLQRIRDTEVENGAWAADHWNAIRMNYARSPYFAEHREFFVHLFMRAAEIKNLSEINFLFLSEICQLLKITTKLSWSTDFQTREGKTERLVSLCQAAGGQRYISGPSAANYIDADQFAAAEIDLQFIDYGHYHPYFQPYGSFTGTVTILDSIFNQGPMATRQSLGAPLVSAQKYKSAQTSCSSSVSV